jgi:phosphoribosylglycinamide formyltransferase-1
MQITPPLKLGFLASHGGSGMRAIVQAIRAGELAAEPRIVISNNRDCDALTFAAGEHVPQRCINAANAGGPEAADAAIAQALDEAGAELVILSGYMRRLGPAVLARYAGRILNIHPALLPRHGGQGMYGRRVHEAVHAAKDTVTGATVHLVESDYDTGPVLARREVPVLPGDGIDEIEARVRAAEPGLYVETLHRIASGEIPLPDPGA